MSGTDAVTEVRPSRGRSGRPNAYADRTVLQVRGSQLVVRDLRGREHQFPLSGARKGEIVRAMVFTRTLVHDKTGDLYLERLSLLNANRFTVCRLPGAGWDREQLAALARTAGVPFSIATLAGRGDEEAYPLTADAVDIPLVRAWVPWLVLILILALGTAIYAVLFLANANS